MTKRCFTFDADRPLHLISMGRVAVDLYAEQIGAALSDAQTFRKYLGGCAGNIAVGSARLGLRVSMLSRVGADDMGKFLRDTLVDEGVDVSHLQTSNDYLTGLVLLGVCPPDHFPLIFYRKDCADMAIDAQAITEEYLSQASALLVTGTGLSQTHSFDATLHAIESAKRVGTKVILDIDYRPVLWGMTKLGDGENRYVKSDLVSKQYRKILPHTDLIIGTEEEMMIAGDSDDVMRSLSNIRQQTCAPLVVKQGAMGARCYFDLSAPPVSGDPYPVTVLNVLGAGDAFMSGLLFGLLNKKSFDDALKHANACGALVVSRHGCAPAMPSRSELSYFENNFAVPAKKAPATCELAALPKLSVLHEATVLKDHARVRPMPIMAFCHRWQLEETCDQFNKPKELIAQFKTLIANALVDLCAQEQIENPYMLCDPQYGEDAINLAQKSNINAIVAIEKSGARLTEWLCEGSAYEILCARPRSWGVKILWQLHRGLSPAEQEHQLTKIKELYRATSRLERKLMLELIVPADVSDYDQQLIESVRRVYQAGVYPYWWKLSAPSSADAWRSLACTIDEFDGCARVVVLGGGGKDLFRFESDFAIAKSTHHGIGFAIGRSIFWSSWLDFLQQQKSVDEIKSQIASRFFKLYRLWMKP